MSYIYIGLIIVFVRTQSHIKKMIGTYRADGWYIKELVDVKFHINFLLFKTKLYNRL
jgi:hypothetical protein